MMKRDELDYDQIKIIARQIRIHCVNMTHRAKSSHIGSSLSMADLLAVLYNGILRIDPANPEWPDRDRFILSKGHACAALYATLAERGFFPIDWLDTFYQNGSLLAGHVTHTHIPGVEVSTGSLGHGLSMATGMALVAKRDVRPYRVFVLLGDGECDEGSTWEATLFANQHQLDNLVAIVDYNKIQSLDHVKKVMDLEPFVKKWQSFGWGAREIDGHSVTEIHQTLSQVPFKPRHPSCVIAHTIKGKGVSFMEDTVLWHYRSPQGEEYELAMAELKEKE